MRVNPALYPDTSTALLVHEAHAENDVLILIDTAVVAEDTFFAGSAILGMISLTQSYDLRGFLAIDAVWARQGWGPAMYELGAAFALDRGFKGIHSDPHVLLPEAEQVWRKFLEREDVTTSSLPAGSIDFALVLKHQRKDYDALLMRYGAYATRAAKRLKLPRAEVKELLVEQAASHFANAMRRASR